MSRLHRRQILCALERDQKSLRHLRQETRFRAFGQAFSVFLMQIVYKIKKGDDQEF